MSDRERTRWGRSLTGFVLACAVAAAIGPSATGLTPGLFTQLASGVVAIRGSDCGGHTRVEGSGFLVGRSVVMTARHVVDPGRLEQADVCELSARVDGEWIAVDHVDWWTRSGDPGGRRADLATVVLAHPADPHAHVFDFRKSSPAVGAPLAMIGYPLGQEIALTQGHLIDKTPVGRVPTLTARLLGAEGASGAPIVDDGGHVVSVLQLGLGGSDVLGQATAGVVQGIDLAAWWGGWKIDPGLCSAYPAAGIPGCAPPPASVALVPPGPLARAPFATAATRASASYRVRRCWLQNTGDAWGRLDAAAAITSVARSQVVARPRAYWIVVDLGAAAPARLVVGARLLNPQGLTSGDEAFTIGPGEPRGAATLDWSVFGARSLVFADPWLGTSGRWQVRLSLPNGGTCGVSFTVR